MNKEVIKLDYFGRGIIKDNNKVIFVDKALPNDIIDYEIIKDKKKYSEARISKIIKESPDRIIPKCPYYNNCGGCDFWHAKDSLEKDFKINKAKELLGQCDGYFDTIDNYRNKVTLHIKDNKIGYYKEKTNDIININSCLIVNPLINKIINKLNKIDFSKYNVSKIIIKCNLDKVLLYLDNIVDDEFIDYLSEVDTIIVKDKVIKGKGYLEEIIDNKVFKITKEAFFQVNKEGLIHILNIIKEYLKDKDINNMLDLYCGESLWGILLNNYSKNITGIEINKESCDNALINIKNNNIGNIKIINGKVEDYLNEFKDIDLIILDPPRNGLDKNTIKYLKEIKSNYLIYISCDMISLKRDLELLKDNYNIKKVYLVNMFKKTYHCEVVTILEKK